MIGLGLFNQKNYAESELEFATAIQYNPKVAHFFLHRGNTLYLQQKFEHAYQDFKEAIRLNPGLTEAQERLDQFQGMGTKVSEKSKILRLSKRQNGGLFRSESLPSLSSSTIRATTIKSLNSQRITENTSRPKVPESVLVARQRQKKAIQAVSNIWAVPDTSQLLKDPLLLLMANGGKGPTKVRNKHKYKGNLL